MDKASLFVFSIFLIFFCAINSISGEEYNYVKDVNPEKMKMKMMREKISHFRLYWHDIVTGSNATSVQILKPIGNSSTYFGSVTMIDNPLTIKPNLSSKMVGRAEGLYAAAGQKEVGVLMIMNFAFRDGKYNGSTLTILGRNNVPAKVREMPIVGGSGLFRFARGFVQAKTVELPANGNAIVEYNVYVIHY